MVQQHAGMFAETDHHHLEEAAFDGTVITGVRLDPRDDADVVGLRSVLVEQHGKALRRSADGYRLHGRPDRRADEALGDSVALQYFALTFRCPAAVATHGGNDERLRP